MKRTIIYTYIMITKTRIIYAYRLNKGKKRLAIAIKDDIYRILLNKYEIQF